MKQLELFGLQNIPPSELPYQVSVALDHRPALQRLCICFEITLKNPTAHDWQYPQTQQSTTPQHNWGLWEHNDVVEVFFQPRPTQAQWDLPYSEWQVSPLGTGFALEIIRPRVQYYCPLRTAWNAVTSLQENSWRTELLIPWDQARAPYLGLGLFACLGPKTKRHYFSHLPDQQPPANFHRPELFMTLEDIL